MRGAGEYRKNRKGGGEKGKIYNLKFRKTKEIFYIHCITIYHPHWKYLTSIFLYNSTLTVAMKSCKSGAQPIISLMGCSKWNLQGKTRYYSLLHVRHKSQQFQVSIHMGFCTVHRSRLAYALTLQVDSNIISIAFAAGRLVCDATHGIYTSSFLNSVFFCQLNINRM